VKAHTTLPLRASKARTTPPGMSVLWKSMILEPVMTRSPAMVGAEDTP
jgi:hypothetical protein